MDNKVAAIGSHSSVVLFRAAGIHTVSAETVKEAEKAVADLVKLGYGIIFLTENYASRLEDELKRYRASAYPVILAVPEKSGPTGYGMRTINANMEKAIGTNIFDKE
ncbi:MAG: V-type ATP synthase subunit F [Eubacteriales bacterium]|nr:V-type ATP synthase subunit F [Eubacteriales bacterium]